MLVAASIIGSYLYKSNSRNSDIDLRVITLNDINQVLGKRQQYEQLKTEKIDIAEFTLSRIVEGLIIGKINEVEIILSDKVIYGFDLVDTLKRIFLTNLNDLQKYNLHRNCLGVIHTCKLRTIQGKSSKPLSVVNKVNYIMSRLYPDTYNPNTNIDKVERQLLEMETLSETSSEAKRLSEQDNLREQYNRVVIPIYKEYISRIIV